MRNKDGSGLKRILAASTLVLAVLCCVPGVARAQSALFADAVVAADADIREPAGTAVVRGRYVSINFDLLSGSGGAAPDGGNITLNLFDNVALGAVMDRREQHAHGYTWYGTIPELTFGQAVLTVYDGDLAGNISSVEANYQIRPLGSGYHAVYEINQGAFPPEAVPLVAPGGGADPSSPRLKDTAADDGSIIDMLVVYTDDVAASYSNIQSLIQLAISETNQGFANSGITTRVRLAGTQMYSYAETGNFCTGSSSDLARIAGTTDGYMDAVHALRNSLNADQVTLITKSGDACGCGYLNSDYAGAFTVVRIDCATGYFSFGHELGHNIGAHHDCYVQNTTGVNHGYVQKVASPWWRTVMAYGDDCGGCTRVNWWSNPNVNYSGRPTGTTGTGCTAYNVSVINENDVTFSNLEAGTCTASGVVKRVYTTATGSYLYLQPASTSNFYTSFYTSDLDLLRASNAAMVSGKYVHVLGSQSCFTDSTDYGGTLKYLYFR